MQRAGALVDVMDALPSALRDRGQEVSVALPFTVRFEIIAPLRKRTPV